LGSATKTQRLFTLNLPPTRSTILSGVGSSRGTRSSGGE
jgi:hypothetical protein